MKILSIDVGIKNLAFCLFNVENEKCSIMKWDVLNLCTLEKEKCDLCNSNANYVKEINKYCTKHAKKVKDLSIPKYTDKQLQKKRHSELLEYYNELVKVEEQHEEEKTTKKKTKNDLLGLIELYYKNNCLKHIEKVKASEIDLISVGINMKEKFNQEFKDIIIDKILIENQISPLANRMKTVQGMITQYFIMKECFHIFYISSANKLKNYVDHKTTYDERKKLSIEITSKIIKKHFTTVNFDNNNKTKKDDLADCMLQGLYYMTHNHVISDKYSCI